MSEDKAVYIVRKPLVSIENDKLYVKAKEASAQIPCAQAAGGHKPMAMKTEQDAQDLTPLREPWGWSILTFKRGNEKTFSHYAYFCEACHQLYYVELTKEETETPDA